MKKKGLFWAIVLICVAIFLIVDGIGAGLGFFAGMSAIKIILGVGCVAWVITELVKLKIPHIFFPLSFLFIIFEGDIAQACGSTNQNLMSNWVVLLSALLLTIGTGIIFSKSKWYDDCVEKGGRVKDWGHKHRIMGKSTKYIDCTDFSYQLIENNMGSCEVFFENVDNYLGNGTIEIDNNMASTIINVPSDWHVVESIDNSLGSIQCASSGNANGKTININGDNNMGSIVIRLI